MFGVPSEVSHDVTAYVSVALGCLVIVLAIRRLQRAVLPRQFEPFQIPSPFRAGISSGVATLAMGVSMAVAYFAEQTTVVFCTLICVFAVVSLARALLFLARLDVEIRRCRRDFRRLQEMSRQDFSLRAFAVPSSLLVSNLVAIERLGSRRGQSEWRTFVEGLSSDLEAENAKSFAAADAVQCLGLIGTVVGMTLMCIAMDQAIADATDGNVSESVRSAIGGLSAAFLTTLCSSVLGSLLLSGLALIALRSIYQLKAHLLAVSELCDFGESSEGADE